MKRKRLYTLLNRCSNFFIILSSYFAKFTVWWLSEYFLNPLLHHSMLGQKTRPKKCWCIFLQSFIEVSNFNILCLDEIVPHLIFFSIPGLSFNFSGESDEACNSAAASALILPTKRMKWVIPMAHLSNSDNNTISDLLVDKDSSLFDSSFDEEDAFLGWSRAIVKKGCGYCKLWPGFCIKRDEGGMRTGEVVMRSIWQEFQNPGYTDTL